MQVCVFYMYMCQYVCVWYVGKRDWTFQHYCWRFRVKPWGKWAEKPALQHTQFPASLSLDSGIAGMHLCGLAEATKPGKQVHLYDPSVFVHSPF